MKKLVLLAAASVVVAAPVSAHDIWLTPGPGGVVVHYGHLHQPEMPSLDKLTNLTAYEPAGPIVLTAKVDANSGSVLRADHDGDALIAASYDNGFWVRLPDGGYRNASKRMVPQGEKSMWSVKYAKAALGPSAPWDRVVGQPLEIVPLEAPASAAGKIKVQVLYDGRPLSGADVVATDGVNFTSEADQARSITDADGVATVPLRTAGPQVLGVSHRAVPSQTPALADTDNYAATFAFTVTDPKTN